MSQPRWVAPPSWPQPPQGWSPPSGWAPDPAWGEPPPGWVWWQEPERPYPPFWKVKKVRETSPRFKKTMAATASVVVLLFVAGALGDDTSDGPTRDAASVSEATAAASPRPSPRPTPSPTPTPTPAPSAAAQPVAAAPATTDETIAQAKPNTALAVLGTLAVKGRAPKTGYDRDLFGAAWTDTDRNGCDTRNDILARDLTGTTFKAGTRDCVVMTGQLADPYTGQTLTFAKADASAIHIDHVVALSDAWQKGAQPWPGGKRLAFANDPLNLLAVDGPTNSSKGDGDAATWLPPNKSYRCAMVARQVAVKARYELWVVAAERDAIARVLSACPNQAVPTGGNPTMAPVAPPKAAAPAPAEPAQEAPPAAPAPAQPAGAKEYANCTELRKDYPGGVAREGAVNQGGATKYKPHYDNALYEANRKSDRDKDGIACEA